MSVVQNPLIGRARQKLGGTVFTTWKGINVIKGKPLSVANPRTDAQTMRRSALTQIVALGRILAAVLNYGFKEQAVRKSPFNAFTGYNLRNAFDYSAPPTAQMIIADLLISQGTISQTTPTLYVADQSANQIQIQYPTTADQPGQSASDLCFSAVYNDDTEEWCVPVMSSNTRSSGTANGACPAGFMTAGNEVRIFSFFYNPTSRKSSDSVSALQTVQA